MSWESEAAACGADPRPVFGAELVGLRCTEDAFFKHRLGLPAEIRQELPDAQQCRTFAEDFNMSSARRLRCLASELGLWAVRLNIAEA